MVGNKVFLTAIYFFLIVCASSCSASGSWKKYSFDPGWKLFGKRGSVKVSTEVEIVPVRSRHGGSPIDSIQIELPQELMEGSLPNSVVVFARDGWYSQDSLEFYLKGVYLYAKKNVGHVFCEHDVLCRVDYSLVPLKDRGKADSYFDYMLTASVDSHAYVSKDLLELDLWRPSSLADAFFAECKVGMGCLRKGLFNNYFFEYKLQPPENNWVNVDIKLKIFLADNVKSE